MLLCSNHRARPAYSYPGNGFSSGHPVMLHNVTAYKRASSAKSRYIEHKEIIVRFFRGSQTQALQLIGQKAHVNVACKSPI